MSNEHDNPNAPTMDQWRAWLEGLHQRQPEQAWPDDERRETFEEKVRKQFRLGNLQFDAGGRVIPGTTAAFGEVPEVRGALQGTVASLQPMIAGPVLLLSDAERTAITAHLEAGLIYLTEHGFPLAAPEGSNFVAASVLAAYLDLALECIALMTGRPRVTDVGDVLRLVRDWPNVRDLLGMA